MAYLSGTRASAADVAKYRKVDTGTAEKPKRKSDKMGKGQTRVKSAGMGHTSPDGMHKSAKMKGTRVTKGGAGK